MKDLWACEHLELTCHSLLPKNGATQAGGGNHQSCKDLVDGGRQVDQESPALTYQH